MKNYISFSMISTIATAVTAALASYALGAPMRVEEIAVLFVAVLAVNMFLQRRIFKGK